MINADYFNFVKPSKIILVDKIDDFKKSIIFEEAKMQGISVTQMSITKYGFRENEVSI